MKSTRSAVSSPARIRSEVLAGVLVLALSMGGLSCQQWPERSAGTSPRLPAADEAAIRALLAENEAAGHQRAAARAAATYTPDGDIWIVDGRRISGTEELR